MSAYWYLFHEHYCPPCGRSLVYRERVYDRPRPDDWAGRHIVTEVYDWCEG